LEEWHRNYPGQLGLINPADFVTVRRSISALQQKHNLMYSPVMTQELVNLLQALAQLVASQPTNVVLKMLMSQLAMHFPWLGSVTGPYTGSLLPFNLIGSLTAPQPSSLQLVTTQLQALVPLSSVRSIMIVIFFS
jgi:hypothetical protein